MSEAEKKSKGKGKDREERIQSQNDRVAQLIRKNRTGANIQDLQFVIKATGQDAEIIAKGYYMYQKTCLATVGERGTKAEFARICLKECSVRQFSANQVSLDDALAMLAEEERTKKTPAGEQHRD
jgi:hypothetical protein